MKTSKLETVKNLDAQTIHNLFNDIAIVLAGKYELLKHPRDLSPYIMGPSVFRYSNFIRLFLSPALKYAGLPDLPNGNSHDGNYQYTYAGWDGHEVSIAVYEDLLCYTNTGGNSGENPGTFIIPINGAKRVYGIPGFKK